MPSPIKLRHPHLLQPLPGRPPTSKAAKLVKAVFSPTGLATGAALVFAACAIRSATRARAAERLLHDVFQRGRGE